MNERLKTMLWCLLTVAIVSVSALAGRHPLELENASLKADNEISNSNYVVKSPDGRTFDIVKGRCWGYFSVDGKSGCYQEYEIIDLSDHHAPVVVVLEHHPR